MDKPFHRCRDILHTILARTPRASNLLVGIEGFSGAGKSTLSKTLALLDTRVEIVHMDDFYRPSPVKA